MDVANGATYKVAPAAFTELGAEVTVIHDEPNGFNINDGCGSQHTEDLQPGGARRPARSSGWPSTATATGSSPWTRRATRSPATRSC